MADPAIRSGPFRAITQALPTLERGRLPGRHRLALSLKFDAVTRASLPVKRLCMNLNLNLTPNRITVGKYLVSPMTRLLDDGGYLASVSIRSGRGSATHDRVFRFDARFANHGDAVAHATAEGMTWLRQRHDA